ncbi:MAG: hypothetical protein LQ344_002703 [Seirophora lacunosa]|nr:MAG: hypothetical protein LQ344_002703 [Seirophora lacunosa]
MDADNLRFFQEASPVQVEQSRFPQQQRATLRSPSPQVKREPSPKTIPADDNNVASIATSPKYPSLESPHKHPIAKTAAQKENRQPSDTLPFRAMNWKSRPLPSPPPPHRQSVSSSSNASPLHTHPNLSFPPRSRHKSTPLPLIKTESEHSDDNDNPTPTTAAARPLTARRSTISASDCKEESRKERLRRKREWKQELQLREDEYGAEQEMLFSAARHSFSPDFRG